MLKVQIPNLLYYRHVIGLLWVLLSPNLFNQMGRRCHCLVCTKVHIMLSDCICYWLQDVKYIQTDGYRAPEAELQNSLAQAGLEGDSGCTTAVDLWSLGIILLEMFSGMKLKETVKSQEWKVSWSRNAAVPLNITCRLHDVPWYQVCGKADLRYWNFDLTWLDLTWFNFMTVCTFPALDSNPAPFYYLVGK